MGESAVVGKAEDWAPEAAEHVQVRRFRGKRQHGGRQCCLAIQPGAPQARAGQEVSDGFQSLSKMNNENSAAVRLHVK